ncbi:hypothetical protein DPMN_096790 [Dreissena polymorpha]|uniref:Uncharacterized protein n=1 Tax=Dreissena polymorpha TaxID=45954 RepID=A0A9D4R531_DREPO|nr:hypothetical protein DPMN_096790 [Dreissena polymorpha]
MRDDGSSLQSQSMRNNLLFSGIPEENASGSETPEVTESEFDQHLVSRTLSTTHVRIVPLTHRFRG